MKIKEIAGHIRNGNVSFVIGAGASKSAGIPMANELLEMVRADYKHCLGGLSKTEMQNYGVVMSRLSPGDREKLILPLLEKAGINWGQIALAAMVQKEHVSRVLTFNFDLILEKALTLLGLQLPIYDFGVAPTDDINRIAKSAVVHLHGQSHGLVLLNSKKETNKHKEQLRPLLRDTVRSHKTIVFGYSGDADGAFDVILEEYNSYEQLIWLGHSKSPAPHLVPLFEKEYATYVGDCDFDQTMINIAQELGIWPPTVIDNPMEHLLEELEGVKNYPAQEDTDIDALTLTCKRLETNSNRWIEDRTPDDKAYAFLISGTSSDEELEGIIAQKDDLSVEAKHAMGWALLRRANRLRKEATTLSGAQAETGFSEVYKKHAQALEIKPDMHEALNNWGFAHYEEAKTLSGEQAQDKLTEACEKYAKALEIKPDYQRAIFNWAAVLKDEVKSLSGKQAQTKFSAVYEIYAKAKPDDHQVLNAWGITLKDEALTLSGEQAQAKFTNAYEKFAKVLEIETDNHQSFNCWGTVLLFEANTLSGELAQIKYTQSQEKLLSAKTLTGKASYNLACVLARTGEFAQALEELVACRDEGYLFNIEHLNSDTDLDGLRGMDGFKEFMKTLEAE